MISTQYWTDPADMAFIRHMEVQANELDIDPAELIRQTQDGRWYVLLPAPLGDPEAVH